MPTMQGRPPPRHACARVASFGGRPSPLKGEGKKSRQRPRQTVVARFVVGVSLRRITVDEWAPVHRMGLAAGLMLDREQNLAVIEVDQVVETVLVFVTFLCDQAKLLQTP